jgi:APA family basic amino acid/polyamine antiporter
MLARLPMNQPAPLRRGLSLKLLVLYGLGNILGAGIYVLVGKVAGHAGMLAPVAFFVAALVAAFTAMSYAELAARYPYSAGEAIYIRRGLNLPALSVLVGLLIVLMGAVSAATIARGFVGYLDVLVELPDAVSITVLVTVLAAIASWGIVESVAVAALVTLVEILGLGLVLGAGGHNLLDIAQRTQELVPPADAGAWQGILVGAFLAFYAFVGFEDMVNVAEEVRQPRRNLPRAILLALGVTTLLYAAVSLTAVLTVPPQQLSASDAPLATVYQRATGDKPVVLSVISMFAVVNGALIQIIMGSRVLYGMSRQGWLPAALGSVWERTRTPVVATAATAAAVLALALWLPLETLARATSFLVLIIFSLVNLSLLRIKRRHPYPPDIRTFPVWIPALGILSSIGLLLFQFAAG